MYPMSCLVARPSRSGLHVLFCIGASLAAPLAAHAASPHRGQPVQMNGIVAEIVRDDTAQRTSTVEYQLEDAQSRRHATLRFDGEPPKGLRTGARLAVTGVAGGDGSILLSSSSVDVQTTHATASAAVVSGVQNTIVIIANFTNATVTSTPSQIQNLM